MGMISSLLVYQYGQARIWFAMSRDRLLPGIFSRVHPKFQDAAHQHLDRGLRRRHSGGHLGHRHVRRALEHRHAVRVHPGLGRRDRAAQEAAGAPAQSFRVPLVPLFPLLSIVCCLVLMMGLPLMTWLRFFVWLMIGLVIYFLFGRKHSTLQTA